MHEVDENDPRRWAGGDWGEGIRRLRIAGRDRDPSRRQGYSRHGIHRLHTNLTRVKFCNKIEEFVSCDAMSDWWNRGVGEISLRTYCFLVQRNILTRFAGLAPVSDWQATIHDMLWIIPTFAAIDHEIDARMCFKRHFDAIDAQLTVYENLLNEAHVLFPRQYGLDYGIVLVILSFV